MKKLLLLILVTSFSNINAQPVQTTMPENSDKPVKLQDIIDAYKAKNYTADNDNEESVIEGNNYHFDRWAWYWGNHLDINGYLVSPLKNYEEWAKYHSPNNHYKTTAATNTSNWAFQGPTSSTGGYRGIGRINSIGFHPTDANTIWIASAGGGAWKTNNGGVSWSSMSHMLPVLGVSDIDIDPTNPNIIYMCTGDKDASDTYSIGIMKSTNAGGTWDTTGLKWAKTQNRLTNTLVINRLNTKTLTVATSDGIYQSTNAGVNWIRNQTGNFKEIVYNPTDTNIMYATGSALVYRSANGGKTWTSISGFSGKGRIAVAVTPANVSIVKLVVCTSSSGLDGIYNSTDTGKTFTKIYGPTGCNGDLISGDNKTSPTTCGKQGWYDLCITINPANANEVYVGGVNTWRSANGGTSWTFVTQWSSSLAGVATVHADKHFMSFHPLIPGRLLQANDGGIYRTDNPASTLWTDMTNGMGITQFYRNAISYSSDFALAGAQDNGTKGLKVATWSEQNGGDGMDCQIDYADSNIYYTSTQYGDIDRHAPAPLGNDQIADNIPGKPTGPWITPFIVSPHNHTHLIAGYQKLYHTDDYGATWDSITLSRLHPSEDVKRVAMTPASTSTIYAVVNSSNNVYYTHGFTPGNTATFTTLTSPYSGNISDIKIDHKNKDHFWITYSGYGTVHIAEYKSGSWSTPNINLPDVPVHCIEVDTSNNYMYVGTDIGVYYLDTTTKQWEVFNNASAMPSIEVSDLGISYKKKELWASTYGRGLWKSALQSYTVPPDTSDTSTYVHIIPYTNKLFNIFPNPNNGVFTVKTEAPDLANKSLAIRIIDANGKTVWKNNVRTNESGLMQINTFGLPGGIYTFDVADKQYSLGRCRLQIE